MKYNVNIIVYPEGDTQEIPHILRLNQIVDINGFPLRTPLQSVKVIAFRVYKKTTAENRNETVTSFHLEQLSLEELSGLSYS